MQPLTGLPMVVRWQCCIRGPVPKLLISLLKQSSRNMSDLAAGKKAAAIQAVNDCVKVDSFRACMCSL